MAAPTLSASHIAALWSDSTSPRSTASINRAVGDVLVAVAIMEDTGNGAGSVTVADATGIVWTRQQEVTTANRTYATVWTAVASSAANTVITFSEGTSTNFDWGARVYHWTGSAGIGTSNKGDAANSAASVTLTGVLANSAIVMAIGDWDAANTNVTYRTADAGTFTEVEQVDDGNLYTIYTGYHADAGASGDTVVGFTDTDPTWSLVAVEVKGTAGAQNIALGQSSETETAQAVAPRKTVALGQPAETEAAQPVGIRKNVALAQVAETETAQQVAARKMVVLGQLVETETAQSVTPRRNTALVQVVETETAQTVSARKTESLGQVTDAETAQAVTARKIASLGQVVETESAQAVSVGGPLNIPVGQVVETESAQAVIVRRLLAMGQPAETELAQLAAVSKHIAVGQVLETETAQQGTASTTVRHGSSRLAIVRTARAVAARPVQPSVRTATPRVPSTRIPT